jgi:hypothetical protein
MAVALQPAGFTNTSPFTAGNAAANAGQTPVPPQPTPGPPIATSLGTGNPEGGLASNMSGGYLGPQGQLTAPTPPPVQQPIIATTPAEFMTPAMQQYVNQFHQSQQAQQGALNSALVTATQGLNARRGAAAKVAATLPHDAQKAYDATRQEQARAAADAASAFTGGTIAGNADVKGNQARAGAGVHATLANQPLLQAGITADYTKGQSALANTDMQNKAALAQASQQFDQSMALAQAQYNEQQQAQQAGFTHDTQMAQLNSTLGTKEYMATHPGGALTPAQQLLQREQYDAYTRSTAPASGPAGQAGFSAGDVDKIHSTPDYQNVQQVLAEVSSGKTGDKNYYGPTKGQSVAAWITNEYGRSNPSMSRLLLAENPGLYSLYPSGK